ncbi:unnamed protein product [Durusdinium trenchii]|uniref:PI3K/PI4K catalytic domain-containing protein n=1 Tax=Durusdinium trenchii TaxID=1381693 RepID=A0ABP0KAV0_9DINO
MGLEAGLAFKAVVLTTSRAVNWFVVYKQLQNANREFQGKDVLDFNMVWMPCVGILCSHLLSFIFMRTEKTRRSKCPALIIALIQVGAILELSPSPLCPGRSKKAKRTPVAVELAQRTEVHSFASSFNLPASSTTSDVPDPASLQSDSQEDLNKLRTRVLRKLCVAQVPESVCCVVFALDGLTANAHRTDAFWNAVDPMVAVVISGILATFLVACGFADIIISMWVKTDFVQDNAKLVQLFYLVEICSWWPFLFEIAQDVGVSLMVWYLSTELIVMIFLVVVGFYAIPGGRKLRGSPVKLLFHFIGQVALATTLSPFLAGANLIFFDNSLTFRFLNRLYYPVRYLHVAWYINQIPMSVHQLALDPVNGFALSCLCIQVLLVYIVVPKLRRESLQHSAEEFQQQTGGALEVSTSKNGDAQIKVRSNTGLRASVFGDSSRNAVEDSFIEVLNAVGDTFEALLLASQADSPRVRCAVLGVAIEPLSKASSTKLLQLLPLILPQLLLDCPLSCFIIEKALSLNDASLVSMVYWQLLGLAADRADRACHMYQEMRLRLLHALLQSDFNGRRYNGDFCHKALALVANQRRLCYQVRMVSRAVASALGGHAGRTAALRQHLAALQERRDRRRAEQEARLEPPVEVDKKVNPEGDEELGMVRVETAQSSSTQIRFDRARSRSQSLDAKDGEDEPVRGKKQVIFAPEVAGEARSTSVGSERPSESGRLDLGRTLSPGFKTERESSSCARCACACFFRKSEAAKVDIISEEWTADPSMQQFGNQDLSLLDTLGTPLPVEPSRPLGKLQPKRCFVANSAVAPVVFAYQEPDSEGAEGETRFYAMKKGDDLRQDAFVLQIFRIMEAAWAKHGLREVSLMPYDALALSAKEGMAAFVPRAKNVATILQEFDGDISQFIKKHCAGSVSAAYDQLCGSTAGFGDEFNLVHCCFLSVSSRHANARYCIATYLLGIGDRHLDNIMITEDGHFFHIDFGFVLGDDPKPGAPSVRVPSEVLEVLRQSGRIDRFHELLREAFVLVRRTARLWTALLSLASSAGGNGVTPLRDHADRAIHTVRQRLHLELDDASAAAEITAEVEQNAVAMLPIIYDKLHQAGLFWH